MNHRKLKLVFQKLIYLGLFAATATSCSKYTLTDNRSTFKDWNTIPMNGKFLRLDLQNFSEKSPDQNRVYYLTHTRGTWIHSDYSLFELDKSSGIMNQFPIPRNNQIIELDKTELVPAPIVIKRSLEIGSIHRNDSILITLNYKPLLPPDTTGVRLPLDQRLVKLDLKAKNIEISGRLSGRWDGIWP